VPQGSLERPTRQIGKGRYSDETNECLNDFPITAMAHGIKTNL
jgi:hypothetical protein